MRRWLSRLVAGGKPAGERAAARDPAGSGARLGAWIREGLKHHRSGDTEAARALYRRVLEADAENPDALYLLGVMAAAEGDHETALGLLERAVAADPADAGYRVALAGELRARGRLEHALAAYESALEQQSVDPAWLNDYANTLRLAGRLADAADAYRRALRIEPDLADTRYNLGSTLLESGDTEGAVAELTRAAELAPGRADARNNLGLAVFQRGRLDDALRHYQRAIALDPGHADAYNNIGLVHQRRHQYDAAIAHYERAIALRPGYLGAASNLGLALQELGRHREAIAQYRRALAIAGSDGLRIRCATVLPVIPESSEAIRAARARLGREVSALLDEPLAVADPVTEVGACNFHLAYHGENDRELQIKTARLHAHACPALLYSAPHCRRGRRRARLRVGFIAKFMHEHSIGRTTRGLVAELSKERFEVHALFVPPFVDDAISRFICRHAEAHLVLPPVLEAARRRIAELELDVLFFQEIGMDPFTYFLAFARLAPVQCVSFGHPDTTGIANMDYFISTDSFEPEGAADHYSERLVELKNLGSLAYYYRPALAQPPRQRADLGLPEDRNLYLCPQTLFKMHPELDPLLAGILRADARGELLLIEGRAGHWSRLLMARFARSMPDLLERIRFLPGYSRADFLSLIAACDVMLDPIHFNGMNTSLEAFAVGTPVITLPKRFQRGRHTAGMYRRMGITDAVASSEREYVELAVRYGTDAAQRAQLKAQILASSGVLYEDAAVVRGFERFFEEACEAARGNGGSGRG